MSTKEEVIEHMSIGGNGTRIKRNGVNTWIHIDELASIYVEHEEEILKSAKICGVDNPMRNTYFLMGFFLAKNGITWAKQRRMCGNDIPNKDILEDGTIPEIGGNLDIDST